jgi:thiamine-phosphate diphosphorylase
VHVGPGDLPVADARRLLGPNAIIGASAHSAQEGITAEGQGADYLGVGSMFPTSTKSDAVVRGPETLVEVREAVSIPCFAIGGITVENIAQAVGAGIDRAAVASGIALADEPVEAARRIKKELMTRWANEK